MSEDEQRLTESPQSFYQLCWQSVYSYSATLQSIYPFILLLVAIKNVILYVDPYLIGSIWLSVLWILMAWVAVFLFAVAIYRTHLMMQNQLTDLLNDLRRFLKLCPTIAIIVLIFAAIIFCTFILPHWLIVSFFHFKSKLLVVSLLLVLGVFILYEIVLCYFVIPLVVVKEYSISMAFYISLHLGKEEYIRIFAVYFILQIYIMLQSPRSHHMQWLISHHLNIFYDLGIALIFLPFVVSLTIYLLHDLLLRNGELTDSSGD